MYRLATTRCLPSLPTFFFASDKASQDADGRDGCTGEKGGLESRIEGLLIPREVNAGGMGDQKIPGRGTTQTHKDGASESHTHALPHRAGRGQEARGAPLQMAWSRAYQGAIVWGLEKTLADAGQDQTPDNREEGAVFVELAHEHQADTGDHQAASRQPA